MAGEFRPDAEITPEDLAAIRESIEESNRRVHEFLDNLTRDEVQALIEYAVDNTGQNRREDALFQIAANVLLRRRLVEIERAIASRDN